MKFFVRSPDAADQLDCILQSQMLQFMPIVDSESAADVVLIPVSFPHNFVLSPALARVRKPVVFLDFTENGWDWDQKQSNVFGTGMTHHYGHFSPPGWAALDDWIREHPPLLTFKRELKRSDKSERMLPIEHLCYQDIPPLKSKAEFDARPIEVNHTWGWSHPSRALLHARIFEGMTCLNIGVISEMNHCEGYFKSPNPRTWASIYKPWYARSPISELMVLQRMSKITLSLPGAGKKCFRSAEAPLDSVMALHKDELAWSFPWDEPNSVLLRPGHEFEDLDAATRDGSLYDRYVAGRENLSRYSIRRYVDEYVIPSIAALL